MSVSHWWNNPNYRRYAALFYHLNMYDVVGGAVRTDTLICDVVCFAENEI